MKNSLVLVFCLMVLCGSAQQNYWQQQVNYSISVTLNDATHALDGFESLEYVNNSPDTLHFIWFHIWPNAYKNDRTAFSEQLLQNHRTDFYFSNAEDKGYINRLNFKVNNQQATIEPSDNIDVIKVLLPEPIAPGGKANVTTPFHVQLPKYFSRGGHVGQDYQVTQWFPKPAVYDAKGWHPMPYLDQGEFYSEFGKFDVEITLPSSYTVAATGQLQDASLLQQLKTSGKISGTTPSATWHFVQERVHDFAWFASKSYKAHYDTAQLSSGKVVDVFSYYNNDNEAWKQSVQYIKDGLHFYSRLLGEYPYQTVSAVAGPDNLNSGGMEYPTITLITTDEDGRELDNTIVHEVGHNWFYGILASNERDHAWMDEGINTYYQKRYDRYKYGEESPLQKAAKGFARKLPNDEAKLVRVTLDKLEKDEPIDLPATRYSEVNYGLSVYEKAADWMAQLENELGTAAFDAAMKRYYESWKFKHPYPDNFQASLQAATGRQLNADFALLHTTGRLKSTPLHRPIKPSFLFNLRDTDKYNYINIAPALGFNNYDKVMIGGMIHNYQLPLNRINFIAGALYGTRSGKMNTFGRASYNVTHRRYDVEAAISEMSYSQNDFELGVVNHGVLYPRIRRIVPSVKLTLYKPDVNYNKRLTIQWKTFFLKEDQLDFKTITTPTDTMDVVGLEANNTVINRLTFTYTNSRTLYPYSLKLNTDQGSGFIRTGFTANYFFNYAEDNLGLKARLFAGKFFYLKSRTITNRFANERYNFNMTGPKGDEDYTYSNYYVGRSEFDGFLSQQIMERDGFFKVRTDLLSNKIGKTDDWLTALNLATDLPDNVNPLRVLPVKIPLKLFIDVGTYSEAWKENPATGRFLYDAGVQVSLFHSILNVYVPILYSKVYRDYFKSTLGEHRFLKTISFSIDLQQLDLKKILPVIPL